MPAAKLAAGASTLSKLCVTSAFDIERAMPPRRRREDRSYREPAGMAKSPAEPIDTTQARSWPRHAELAILSGGLTLFFVGSYLLAASIIAAVRGHHQLGPILVINLFLGWTILG
jgi:hypothetical protein